MDSNRFTSIFVCILFSISEGNLASQIDINPTERAYDLRPLDGVFGAEINGLILKELRTGQDDDVISQLTEDFDKYKLIIVRDQGRLEGEEQMNITKLFRGELNCIHDDHPNAPHRCVVTLANSPKLGLDRRGRNWHIDGSQREQMDDITIYHMVEVPSDGRTVFLPSKQCVDRFTKEQREKFERVWYVMINDLVMPYLIVHPFSGDIDTLEVFRAHLYNFKTFIYDYGTKHERKLTDLREKQELFREMWMHFEDTCWNLTYTHTWMQGDVVITDNMAMAHRATKEAFLAPEQIGPRVLHRTSTLTSRIPKPVRGFGSAKWEESQECVQNDNGLCAKTDKKDAKQVTQRDSKDTAEKDEL